MKNTYEIEKSSKGFVSVRGKRYSWSSAADIFRVRMYNTFAGMQDGKISKKVRLTIEEV